MLLISAYVQRSKRIVTLLHLYALCKKFLCMYWLEWFHVAVCGQCCSSRHLLDDKSHPISRACNISCRQLELSDVNMPDGSRKETRLTENVYRGRRSRMASGNVNGMLQKQQILSKFWVIVWISDIFIRNCGVFLVHFCFTTAAVCCC